MCLQELFLCEHRNTGGWGGGHRRKITASFVADNVLHTETIVCKAESESHDVTSQISAILVEYRISCYTLMAPEDKNVKGCSAGVCHLYLKSFGTSIAVVDWSAKLPILSAVNSLFSEVSASFFSNCCSNIASPDLGCSACRLICRWHRAVSVLEAIVYAFQSLHSYH